MFHLQHKERKEFQGGYVTYITFKNYVIYITSAVNGRYKAGLMFLW